MRKMQKYWRLAHLKCVIICDLHVHKCQKSWNLPKNPPLQCLIRTVPSEPSPEDNIHWTRHCPHCKDTLFLHLRRSCGTVIRSCRLESSLTSASSSTRLRLSPGSVSFHSNYPEPNTLWQTDCSSTAHTLSPSAVDARWTSITRPFQKQPISIRCRSHCWAF